MKKIISVFSVFLMTTSAFASAIDMSCSGSFNTDYNKTDLYVSINKLEIDQKGIANIKEYSLTAISKDPISHAPVFETVTYKGSVQNLPYKGKKYLNHLKFDLLSGSSLGNLDLYKAELIVSPSYTVTQSIVEANHWTPSWTWTIEVRQHSAVLALSLSDQDGTYVKLNCFSQGIVNEKRP